MNFIHGTSSEEEKELQFRRQPNEEFYAQKKQQHVKDVSKKTCFKCDQAGHVRRKCPNLKPVDVEQKRQQTVAVKQKSTKFESQQTWKPKPKTPRDEPKQIWKQKVGFQKSKQIWQPKTSKFEPKQIWKPKIDSRFYQRKVSKGQIWVEKKQNSVSDN
ncbi:putative transcription factor interactor and regulator CCHC(Zn) family [Helianthus anomalus]